jgi:hypothetical protein
VLGCVEAIDDDECTVNVDAVTVTVMSGSEEQVSSTVITV